MSTAKSKPQTMNGASQRTLNQWQQLRAKAVKKYQDKQRTKTISKKKTGTKEIERTLTKKLTPVYHRLLNDWLPHNRRCFANLEGCTIIATECHHRFKRTGWWLIVMELWGPVCCRCHRKATKNSKDAINSGVSISRHSNIKPTFNKHVLSVLKIFNIHPPS